MAQDWTGNSRSTYSTLGASNHSSEDRQEDDFYATDPKAVEALLKVEKFTPYILEPACGMGHISHTLEQAGYEVISQDKVYRGYGLKEPKDFFEIEKTMKMDIVTNPPYKYAAEFVEHALDIVDEGSKVAMFLKLTFLESVKRLKLFKKYPPQTVYVFSKRQVCAKNGDFDAANTAAVVYAWFVWKKGFTGDPVIKWL